jgi:hypothetical protein
VGCFTLIKISIMTLSKALSFLYSILSEVCTTFDVRRGV